VPILALLVGLAAMALYLPSLDADFIIVDDPQYTTTNAYVRYPTMSKLAAFFTEVGRPSTVVGYYQPLTMASLMLDRVIEGHLAGGYFAEIDPFVFHFTNVLLHGVNSALVFLLAQGITRKRPVALICGLLFAVHPLNVEVVAWVCQRKALLSTMFGLLTMLTYGKFALGGPRRWLILSVASFGFCMLSKPTGAFLPVVLVLADTWPLRRFSRRTVLEKWPFFIIALVGGWIAYRSQSSAIDLTVGGEHRGLAVTSLIACHNIVFYLAKLVVPIRLCPEYVLPSESVVTLARPVFAAGVIGTALLMVGALYCARRGGRAIWVCLASFIVLIGPTLGPVRFSGTIAADRFAYLPMIAVIVLLAEGLRWMTDRRAAEADGGRIAGRLGAASAVVVALLAVLTVRQQQTWQDSRGYYQSVVTHHPEAPAGYYGLGNAYLDLYQKSFLPGREVEPVESRAWLAEAMSFYEKTLQIDPGYSYAYYRVGHILILCGRADHGVEMIQRGLAQDRPHFAGNYFLGLAYSHLGEYDKAIEPYEKCLIQRPSWIEVRRNLANALLRTGRAEQSLEHYQKLYELNPSDLDGLQNWGVALLTVGQVDEAVERLRSVVDLRARMVRHGGDNPSESQSSKLADARYTLAGALVAKGDIAAAADELRDAFAGKPSLIEEAGRNELFAPLRETAIWRQLVAESTARASATQPAG